MFYGIQNIEQRRGDIVQYIELIGESQRARYRFVARLSGAISCRDGRSADSSFFFRLYTGVSSEGIFISVRDSPVMLGRRNLLTLTLHSVLVPFYGRSKMSR
ncbi:hypothetical protein AVEN_177316-1 [Araneus ventricosus]|uniref:Uncharacterized protein n=1 Tax=Araneus ventricosus TaxID=182803 RepID=A0A4Y2C5D2_ARAVE|nr:hypothetical protein AVEN_177316-1 [Araneus ventricosus]